MKLLINIDGFLIFIKGNCGKGGYILVVFILVIGFLGIIVG